MRRPRLAVRSVLAVLAVLGAVLGAGPVVHRVAAQTPPAPAAGLFNAINPTRVLDTRSGIGGTNGPLLGGQTIAVQVTNVAGVPATAIAVAFNVTAVAPTADGWLTIWPADAARPEVSSINFVADQTVPNMVQMRPSADGRINITTPAGAVHVLVDIAGYYEPNAGARYFAITPSRGLDTRATNRPIAPNSILNVAVLNLPDNINITSVAYNVTVISGGAAGYATVYPGDRTTPPDSSNLNFAPNQVVANFVIAGLSTSRQFRVFNGSGAPIHMILDRLGFFAAVDGGPSPFGYFVPIDPVRILDTRRAGSGGIGANGPIGPNSVRDALLANTAGLPNATLAQATVLNATVTSPTAEGWVRIWSSLAEPATSNVNFRAGQTIANHAVIPFGSPLSIGYIRNSEGSTHVILDATGYYRNDPALRQNLQSLRSPLTLAVEQP